MFVYYLAGKCTHTKRDLVACKYLHFDKVTENMVYTWIHNCCLCIQHDKCILKMEKNIAECQLNSQEINGKSYSRIGSLYSLVGSMCITTRSSMLAWAWMALLYVFTTCFALKTFWAKTLECVVWQRDTRATVSTRWRYTQVLFLAVFP